MPCVRTDVVVERVDPTVRDGTCVDEGICKELPAVFVDNLLMRLGVLLGGGAAGGTALSHFETEVLCFFNGPGLLSSRELRT